MSSIPDDAEILSLIFQFCNRNFLLFQVEIGRVCFDFIQKSLQIADRINFLTIDMNFIMDVRTCAKACAAHVGDNLSALDTLTCRHDDLRGVTVARHNSIAVIDVNHISIAA